MATVMSGGGDWIGFPVNHRSTMPASAPHARAAFSSPVYLYCFQLKRKWKELQMNSSSNLLVLGVTGQVGKLVAKHLKRSKANFSVGSRRKANLEELADQFGASRFIDLDDPRTFNEALKDITGIFLITGYTVAMLVQSKSLIDAAKRNGVTHIVHLGAFTREHDSYATVFAWHQMIEAYLRDSGVAWTNLHPNMFMQNFLSVWSIKGGLYSAYTSKAIGFTALEDVAEAAAVILMEGPEKRLCTTICKNVHSRRLS